MVYPGPFYNDTKISQQPIHYVYRSAHMPLQHFAIQHPEYQFSWNWETDIRYTGHYYELFQQLGQWAKDQPRKGLWERNAKYYIPALHNDWKGFSNTVQEENRNGGNQAIRGPVSFPRSKPILEQYTAAAPHDRDNGAGGREREEKGSGRMCLRSVLLHPIKYETGPMT